MALSDSDENTSVVVGIIRDLTKRVDDYEANSSADRADFKATIEASVVQLRRCMYGIYRCRLCITFDHVLCSCCNSPYYPVRIHDGAFSVFGVVRRNS